MGCGQSNLPRMPPPPPPSSGARSHLGPGDDGDDGPGVKSVALVPVAPPTSSADGHVAAALRQKRKAAIYGEGGLSALRSPSSSLASASGGAPALPSLAELAQRISTPKPAPVRALLARALADNVFFADFSADAIEVLVGGLSGPLDVPGGEEVIRQGDAGDYFYVVERGQFAIVIDGARVAVWGEGTQHSSFGELALIYNLPRAASVVAAPAGGRLWSIDRLNFRTIAAAASRAASDKLSHALRKGILEDLTDEQHARLHAAATIVRYRKGDKIVAQVRSCVVLWAGLADGAWRSLLHFVLDVVAGQLILAAWGVLFARCWWSA